MMSAAAMGATAFQKGLGAIHALSHPVGALYNTHHGMTNAVVMPTVLRFNRPAIEERLSTAAAYLGIGDDFDSFYDYVIELRAEIGVPDKLAALGVDDARIDDMAAAAIEDPCAAGNPVELTIGAAKNLYEDAI
jgi:alcohol dehydrogenase class IV